jgi:PBP1b-binding outer membrane lipoprotein LpoB
MKVSHAILGAALLLTACAKPSPADNSADQLENAAEQSDPSAAAVLDNEADAIRDSGVVSGNSSDPGSTVQNAMQNAGDAQASNSQ